MDSFSITHAIIHATLAQLIYLLTAQAAIRRVNLTNFKVELVLALAVLEIFSIVLMECVWIAVQHAWLAKTQQILALNVELETFSI